MVNVKY